MMMMKPIVLEKEANNTRLDSIERRQHSMKINQPSRCYTGFKSIFHKKTRKFDQYHNESSIMTLK